MINQVGILIVIFIFIPRKIREEIENKKIFQSLLRKTMFVFRSINVVCWSTPELDIGMSRMGVFDVLLIPR